MPDLSVANAEQFVYRECRLLDERRLDEWLALFTEDGIYWLPSSDHAHPEQEPSLVYDDTVQRTKRVHQLLRESHLAQMPPSRTVHLVSNVEVEEGEAPLTVVVRCNVLVAELRPGDHSATQYPLGSQRLLAGRCEYALRRQPDEWAIAMKKVLLIDRDLPIYNLTFIV